MPAHMLKFYVPCSKRTFKAIKLKCKSGHVVYPSLEFFSGIFLSTGKSPSSMGRYSGSARSGSCLPHFNHGLTAHCSFRAYFWPHFLQEDFPHCYLPSPIPSQKPCFCVFVVLCTRPSFACPSSLYTQKQRNVSAGSGARLATWIWPRNSRSSLLRLYNGLIGPTP